MEIIQNIDSVALLSSADLVSQVSQLKDLSKSPSFNLVKFRLQFCGNCSESISYLCKVSLGSVNADIVSIAAIDRINCTKNHENGTIKIQIINFGNACFS